MERRDLSAVLAAGFVEGEGRYVCFVLSIAYM
jgi:hypothetical protein